MDLYFVSFGKLTPIIQVLSTSIKITPVYGVYFVFSKNYIPIYTVMILICTKKEQFIDLNFVIFEKTVMPNFFYIFTIYNVCRDGILSFYT